MNSFNDERWLSVEQVKQELLARVRKRDEFVARAVLSEDDIVRLIRKGVRDNRLVIRNSIDGKKYRWPEVRGLYGGAPVYDGRRPEPGDQSESDHYNPFGWCQDGNSDAPQPMPPPRAPRSKPIDRFLVDPDVQLNLREVKAFIEREAGVVFPTEVLPGGDEARIGSEEATSPGKVGSGRPPKYPWQECEDMLVNHYMDENMPGIHRDDGEPGSIAAISKDIREWLKGDGCTTLPSDSQLKDRAKRIRERVRKTHNCKSLPKKR